MRTGAAGWARVCALLTRRLLEACTMMLQYGTTATAKQGDGDQATPSAFRYRVYVLK